jgi:hypothetical protein
MPVILPPPIPPIIFTPHLIHASRGGGGGDEFSYKLFLSSMIATGVIGAGALVYIHFKYRNPLKGIHKESRDLQLYARYLYRFYRNISYKNIHLIDYEKDVYLMFKKHHPKYYTKSKLLYYQELMKKESKELMTEKDFYTFFDTPENDYNKYYEGNFYGATPEDYHKAKAYFLVAKKFDEDFGRPRSDYERPIERMREYLEYLKDSRH